MIEWTEAHRDLPLDFELEFVAVDLAGNKSRPSKRIRVQHAPEAPN
jgi:hypothetical protein